MSRQVSQRVVPKDGGHFVPAGRRGAKCESGSELGAASGVYLVMSTTKTQPKSRAEGARQLARLLDEISSYSASDVPGVSIIDVGSGQCRFIIDDGAFPAICCGARARCPSSWCDRHAEIVFTPTGRSYFERRLSRR
jgi:hypothetical protein